MEPGDAVHHSVADSISEVSEDEVIDVQAMASKNQRVDRPGNHPLAVGSRVSARFGGSSGDEWYGGVIARAIKSQTDGMWMYDINYDDGDQDIELEQEWVRPAPGTAMEVEQPNQRQVIPQSQLANRETRTHQDLPSSHSNGWK